MNSAIATSIVSIIIQVIIVPATCNAISFSAPIPIFDKAKFIKRESPDSGPWTDIAVQGSLKKISTLKSTAKLTPCSEFRSDVLAQNLNDSLMSIHNQTESVFNKSSNLHGFIWTTEEKQRWQPIESVMSLEPIACATIDYNKFVIEIVYLQIEAKLKEESKGNISGFKLLHIIARDKNLNIRDSILGLSIQGNFDGIRSYKVKLIADVDNDDGHEFLIEDGRYEGGWVFYYKLDNAKLIKFDINSSDF